jgi:hypothetical protein
MRIRTIIRNKLRLEEEERKRKNQKQGKKLYQDIEENTKSVCYVLIGGESIHHMAPLCASCLVLALRYY